MLLLAVILMVGAGAEGADAQVRRGRPIAPDVPPWAPIAVGVRFGLDQEAGGEVIGGQIRLPVVRSGLVEFVPNVDVLLLSGVKEYQYNLNLAYVPGGAGGGIFLEGGVGWRDSVLGSSDPTAPSRTYFGFNLGAGGRTNVGPVQLEILIRWVFLNDTSFRPNPASLGFNFPLWARPPSER